MLKFSHAAEAVSFLKNKYGYDLISTDIVERDETGSCDANYLTGAWNRTCFSAKVVSEAFVDAGTRLEFDVICLKKGAAIFVSEVKEFSRSSKFLSE